MFKNLAASITSKVKKQEEIIINSDDIYKTKLPEGTSFLAAENTGI